MSIHNHWLRQLRLRYKDESRRRITQNKKQVLELFIPPTYYTYYCIMQTPGERQEKFDTTIGYNAQNHLNTQPTLWETQTCIFL